MRALPTHQRLFEELRGIRRPGLPKLRHCPHEALREAAAMTGTCTGEDDALQGIERLLAAAAQHLTGGGPLRDTPDCDPLARAAAHTFGLFADRRGVAAADRRKAAAAVYGVTTERFRRSQEPDVLSELAAAVLALARASSSTVLPFPPPSGPVPAHVADRIAARLCPIEEVRGSDILVSSENIYLEMSKTFRPTVSAALRRAAAFRDTAEEIVDDVLPRELNAWRRSRGRTGQPVPAGTVVPTSPGALAAHGVRRIYHAAVSTPVENGNHYHTTPAALTKAVHESFALAEKERKTLSMPLSTICFPLLGAGHGGLDTQVAAHWLVRAIRRELTEDSTWHVTLVARDRHGAEVLRAANSAP